MKIIVTKNYEELSARAAEVMLAVVKFNPKAILGLATGSSPIGLYREMIRDHEVNGTSYKQIQSVNLDEYVGLDAASDQSYVYFMHDNLFNHIDILEDNINLPNGKAQDLQKECDRYNALLEKMQQDIQLLGIGSNGHIAFNEPGSALDSVTHAVQLKDSTIRDNARFFHSIEDVPTKALSMGLKNIMNAKRILLVANGAGKAKAVLAMVKGRVTEECPASVLQLHPDCTVVLDEAAASLL